MDLSVFIRRIKGNVSIANVSLDAGLMIGDSSAEMETLHSKHLVEIQTGNLQSIALSLDTLSCNTDLEETT